MFLNKDRQCFTKAVAIIIALQGLVWFALSITGIVIYSSPPDKLTYQIHTYDRYVDYLSRIIYDEFMGGIRDRIIRPTDFLAFLCIYTFFSVVWVALSVDLYAAIQYKKLRQSIMNVVLGVVVLSTSIIDLVFMSLLARDLNTCPFSLITASTSGGTAIDCQLANGIILTVVARGFLLWTVNVVMAIFLIVIGVKMLKTPTLLRYEKNTIPRVQASEIRKQPSQNEMIFLGDNNGFVPSPLPSQNGGRNRNSSNSTPMALSNKNQTMYY